MNKLQDRILIVLMISLIIGLFINAVGLCFPTETKLLERKCFRTDVHSQELAYQIYEAPNCNTIGKDEKGWFVICCQ